jgi:immune inhibitor A
MREVVGETRRAARARTFTTLGRVVASLAVIALFGGLIAGERAPAAESGTSTASGFTFNKLPQPQPLCGAGAGQNTAPTFAYDRNDCGFVPFSLSGNATSVGIVARLYHPDTREAFANVPVVKRTTDALWQFSITPNATWPAGKIDFDILVPGEGGPAGGAFFRHNFLAAQIEVAPKASGKPYVPGEDLPVRGRLVQLSAGNVPSSETPVSGTYSLRVVAASGAVLGTFGPLVANKGGTGLIAETIPGSVTAGLAATTPDGLHAGIAIEAVDSSYTDPATGAWAAREAGATGVLLSTPPETLVLANSFVSDVGWVKPGETYPWRIFVKNYSSTPRTNARVTVPPADGMTFTRATTSTGTATIGPGGLDWTIPTVPAGSADGPAVLTLVVEGSAKTTADDPEVVWKDLSTTATLSYEGGTETSSSTHGPKVIPADSTYDTARYGDRPFAVVPVDYWDRKHQAPHTAERLAEVINSPDEPGSTFNLYQEMSYGQLFPNGTVPSAGIVSADWNVEWKSPRYRDGGWRFTTAMPGGACYGASFAAAAGTPVYAERIKSGWYQLPGDTAYYGADRTTIAGAIALGGSEIDNACGTIGKAVYDAAHIADPEVDYSDYDTDKDGVVDFFMMVFVGKGGNGDSQLNERPPYDNIWPHSSSLEFYYEDPETKLTGYISDDQLTDLHGRPMYYRDTSYTKMTTAVTPWPVYVRVGPYNVNPESAIDHASVISHEYGHSLGLPDFYTGPPEDPRTTYGDWSLMATDKSQHMDVFSKQELGWLIPRDLKPGSTTVSGWRDSKANTNRIDWYRPDGTPYTLTGPNVRNGEAYAAKLPRRLIIDPQKVADGASLDHVWWSGSGNDFGCPKLGGHTLDVILPELANVPAGTPITVTFKSYWDIEWDYDYGFVMVTTDGGETYRTVPSAKGYTTPAAFNPNNSACQRTWGNGLTGTSGSYAAGTQAVDRVPVAGGYPDGGFIPDEYDISFAAGTAAVLRFAYATDPGFAGRGWFIDDIVVKAGNDVIYSSDFEQSGEDLRLYNGACRGELTSGKDCLAGWSYVNASAGSSADHAYYLELRDRSGFDFDGKGQADRGAAAFSAGLLLVYTDESHGYGNYATPDPPAQHPLDSQPQPGNRTPGLNDAAWTAADGDASFTDSGPGHHVDNYTDPSRPDELWHFDWDCLTFDVQTMSGEDAGPALAPGDLTADVAFTMGPGCVYRSGGAANFAPEAVIQTRPDPPSVREGEIVTFDGGLSTDDRTPVAELGFEWDFEGDGVWDATGQTASHRYGMPGSYEAKLRVTDADGASTVARVTVEVGSFCQTTSWSDDLEPAPEAGWQLDTAVNTLGPLSPTWAAGLDPSAHSASNSWSSDAKSLDLKDDRLVAPPVDLGPTSKLTFWHRYQFENTFDGGVLEISRDGGTTWVDVLAGGGSFVEGEYDDVISTEWESPIAGRQAWTGGPDDVAVGPMSKVVVDLGAFAGEDVLVRWRLATDTLGGLPGQAWWIDDVEFDGIPLPCNRPPIASDDAASTVETDPVQIDVLANDTDPEGAELRVTGATQPGHGSAAVNTDGTVTYRADAGFVGEDAFAYTITDGENTSSARVVVTVARRPNEPPVARDDSAETYEDTAVEIAVLANDTDPEGDTLTLAGLTQPANGSASGNANGTVTYTPQAAFLGSDSFTYTVSDGNGNESTATVTVSVVERPNRPPTAMADSATTQEDEAVTVYVVANDSDPDGDALTVTGVTQPANGSAVANAGGTVTYTPASGFVGTDTFTYTVSDGRGGTSTASVTIAVTEAPNRPPLAVDDAASVKRDKQVTIGVLANDTDPDGDALTVESATAPASGTVMINRGRTITYRAVKGFVGTDHFTYTVGDGKGGSASATVTITVTKSSGSGG